MPVDAVTLEGPALIGYEPPPFMMATLQELPPTVRLGCRGPLESPEPIDPTKTLQLANYFRPERMAAPPPTSTNRREKAASALARMYANDTHGDCVIASAIHLLGLWSANDDDSEGIIQATDQEVLSQYASICGPGDNGCYINAVLKHTRDYGLVAGGKTYKLDDYVACDWTSQLLTQTAVHLFGGVKLGIRLPKAWTQNAVWDVTNSQIVGGHDVPVIDVVKEGVIVSSWARQFLITWRAFTARTWITEAWVMLDPTWYGKNQLAAAASGVDFTTLKRDMKTIREGGIPPIPEPTPPPPPPPPAGGLGRVEIHPNNGKIIYVGNWTLTKLLQPNGAPMHPRPTTFPLDEVTTLLGYLRGTPPAVTDTIHAACVLVDYAAFVSLPATPPPAGAPLGVPAAGFSTATLQQRLEWLQANQGGAMAASPMGLDWKGLIKQLVELVLSLI